MRDQAAEYDQDDADDRKTPFGLHESPPALSFVK
jgi:hypothetical protein